LASGIAYVGPKTRAHFSRLFQAESQQECIMAQTILKGVGGCDRHGI
jgi:hypothetical protein